MRILSSNMSRRSFLTRSIAVGCASLIPAPFQALAQEASLTGAQFRASGKSANVSTHLLRRDVRVLMGSGGNILALPGTEGLVAVDSGLATSENQVRGALKALSSYPLRHLLNTHWHFDHTDGNEWMHRAGAEIIAQENTRSRMNSNQVIPAFSMVLTPSPAGALPTVVFKQSLDVLLNGERIQMKRYTPAHTDSDTGVFFTEANILHTGDTWFNGYYPFIDYDSGGSINGIVKASSENLALVDSATIVVPGHGAPGTRSDLIAFHDMLLDTRGRVSDLKKKGLSVEEAIKVKPTARYDQKLGGGFVPPDLFVRLIYRGI